MTKRAGRAKSPPKKPMAPRLTIPFVCVPPTPPKAVLEISDSPTRDVATEVHNAAWTVCRCIKKWSEWAIPELNQEIDELTAIEVRDKCSAALFALCIHGAFTPTFRNLGSTDEVVKLLPNCSMVTIWARPDYFRTVIAESLTSIGPLYAECSNILKQLAVAPLTAFGWTGDVNGGREAIESDQLPLRDASTEARDAWIYENAMKGTPWSTIKIQLNKKPKSWGRIDTDNGIKHAATAFARRRNYPLPPLRKSGRPTSENTNK